MSRRITQANKQNIFLAPPVVGNVIRPSKLILNLALPFLKLIDFSILANKWQRKLDTFHESKVKKWECKKPNESKYTHNVSSGASDSLIIDERLDSS